MSCHGRLFILQDYSRRDSLPKKAYEDDKVFAFHDIQPGAPTHILSFRKSIFPALIRRLLRTRRSSATATWLRRNSRASTTWRKADIGRCTTWVRTRGSRYSILHLHLLGGRKMAGRRGKFFQHRDTEARRLRSQTPAVRSLLENRTAWSWWFNPLYLCASVLRGFTPRSNWRCGGSFVCHTADTSANCGNGQTVAVDHLFDVAPLVGREILGQLARWSRTGRPWNKAQRWRETSSRARMKLG